MIAYLKILLNEYLKLINQQLIKTSVEVLLVIGFFLLFLFYSYYHQFLAIVIFTIIFILTILLLVKINYQDKTIFQAINDLLKLIIKKDSYQIRLIYIPLLFLFLCIIMGNITLIKILIINFNFKFSNILVGESSILFKLSKITIFYSVYLFLIYNLGLRFIKLLKLDKLNSTIIHLSAFTIGFIPVMLGTFFITLSGALYSWIMWLFFIMLIFFSFKEVKNTFQQLIKSKITLFFNNRFQVFKSLVIVTIFILLSISLVNNIKPLPNDYDSNHSYYNTPLLLTEYHYYKPLKHFVGSNMGQNTEMIYTGIISILNEEYIVNFQFFLFILSIITVYCLLKFFINDYYAVVGLLCFYFIPWNFNYINQNKVEMLLLFYSLLCVYLFLIYLKLKNKKYLYLLGILAGICLGIKYSSLFLIFSIYFILAMILVKQLINKEFKLVKPLIFSVFLIVIFFSPWAIKNQYYFQNIFYPYEIWQKNQQPLNNFDNHQTYYKQRNTEINSTLYGYRVDKLSIISTFNYFFNQSTGKNTINKEFCNAGFLPFFILIAILIYLKPTDNKQILSLWIICLINIILWYFFASSRIWYGFIGITLVYLLLPHFLIKNKYLALIYSIFIFSIIFSYRTMHFKSAYNNLYLIGIIDKSGYIHHEFNYSGAAAFINNLNLPKNEKVLLLKDFQVALYLQNDERFYIDLFLGSSGAYMNNDPDLNKIFKKCGVKYVIDAKFKNKIFNYKNGSSNKETVIPTILEDNEKILNFLSSNSKVIYSDNFFDIYELISDL